MTRIDYDDQRIREMTEAQAREAADRAKKDQSDKVTKSFNEVMTQRSQRETAKTQARANDKAKQDKAGESAQKKNLLPNKQTSKLNQNAALARQAAAQLGKARTGLDEGAKDAEKLRSSDLSKRDVDEKETVDRDVRKDDLREAEVEDRRYFEAKTNVQPDQLEPIDRDGHQRRDQREGQPEQDNSARGVAATEGPRAAQQVKIPHEVIEHLAKAIKVAVDKGGGVEVQIDLKGTMLDGVTLKVSAKKGKVRCVFENCDRNLGNLIESSKGDLMRHLAKRGLELDILRTSR